MSDFFRFPSTPHISWLGASEAPREDKMLSLSQVHELLAGEVEIEEKLDGANVGISISADDEIRVQNRGQYLSDPYMGQFSRLPIWLTQHTGALRSILTPNLIIFGEWCAARHSISYEMLPDLFLMFDVYDRNEHRFWSTAKRNQLAHDAGLVTVPTIATYPSVSLSELKKLVKNETSRFRMGQPMEGIIVRKNSADWCELRAKLVRADFTQSISEHWSKRPIEWNYVDYTSNN